MIRLTKLDHSLVAVNLETVKYIEPMPDTLIVFLNGDSLIVRESVDEILERVVAHKATILALATKASADSAST